MSDTKTYPLSAIIGEELTDKERIAELTNAFNRVCAENADFVRESNKDEARIAELTAQLKHAEGHAAELEAERDGLREALRGLLAYPSGQYSESGDFDAVVEKAEAALKPSRR